MSVHISEPQQTVGAAAARKRVRYPKTVRWVSIDPAGRVEVHESSNRRERRDVPRDPGDPGWVQWDMVLDIYAVIDPAGRCEGHLMSPGQSPDDIGGFFISACCRTAADPLNPVAGFMMAQAFGHRHDLRTPWTCWPPVPWLDGYQPRVRGTVAWLAGADYRYVHPSVTDEQVERLSRWAARWAAQLANAPSPIRCAL